MAHVGEETHFVTFNQNISVGIPNLQLTIIIRYMACKSQLDNNMHLASNYFYSVFFWATAATGF